MPTVLVVEDERDIRDLLRRYLERADYAVLTSATGSEAIAHLEGGTADLVLLDLGLPDIDGFEVLKLATVLGVPVIALTARSSVEDRIRGLERGADDYVTKPFSPQEVDPARRRRAGPPRRGRSRDRRRRPLRRRPAVDRRVTPPGRRSATARST